jgi:hypothetical protein
MLRKFVILVLLAAAVFVSPAQGAEYCHRHRRHVADCRPRDHLVWHPEWGAYGIWGYGACWRWDFPAGRWVYICY